MMGTHATHATAIFRVRHAMSLAVDTAFRCWEDSRHFSVSAPSHSLQAHAALVSVYRRACAHYYLSVPYAARAKAAHHSRRGLTPRLVGRHKISHHLRRPRCALLDISRWIGVIYQKFRSRTILIFARACKRLLFGRHEFILYFPIYTERRAYRAPEKMLKRRRYSRFPSFSSRREHRALPSACVNAQLPAAWPFDHRRTPKCARRRGTTRRRPLILTWPAAEGAMLGQPPYHYRSKHDAENTARQPISLVRLFANTAGHEDGERGALRSLITILRGHDDDMADCRADGCHAQLETRDSARRIGAASVIWRSSIDGRMTRRSGFCPVHTEWQRAFEYSHRFNRKKNT